MQSFYLIDVESNNITFVKIQNNGLFYLNDNKYLACGKNFSKARQAFVLGEENTSDRRVAVSRGKADNVSRLSHWLPPMNVHPRKVHLHADPRWHSEELRIQVAFQKIKRYCESTFTIIACARS